MKERIIVIMILCLMLFISPKVNAGAQYIDAVTLDDKPVETVVNLEREAEMKAQQARAERDAQRKAELEAEAERRREAASQRAEWEAEQRENARIQAVITHCIENSIDIAFSSWSGEVLGAYDYYGIGSTNKVPNENLDGKVIFGNTETISEPIPESGTFVKIIEPTVEEVAKAIKENMPKVAEAVEANWQKWGYSSPEACYMELANDQSAAAYVKPTEIVYECPVKKDNNGNYYYDTSNIKEEDAGVFQFTGTTYKDPVTGQSIECQFADSLTGFMDLGKKSSAPAPTSSPKPSPTPSPIPSPSPSPIPSVTPTPTSKGIVPESVTHNRTNMDKIPHVSGEISGDTPKYDASGDAIPTSENLHYKILADKALYDISVKEYIVKTELNEVKVSLKGSYKINETTKVGNNTKTNTRKIDFDSELDTISKSDELRYYEIINSKIYPLKAGEVKAVGQNATLNQTYTFTSDEVKVNNMLNTWKITFPATEIKIDTTPITYDVGNIGTFNSRTEVLDAITSLYLTRYKDQAQTEINNRVKKAKDEYDSHTHPDKNVTFEYGDLSLTYKEWDIAKREPNIGKVSKVVTKVIDPERYENGLYTGGDTNALAVYEGYNNAERALYTKYDGIDRYDRNDQAFHGPCNQIKIHTPVVNNARVEPRDNKLIQEQVIAYTNSKKYIMLDEEFSVIIPDNSATGTNPFSNYQGYNNPYNSKQGVNKNVTTWGKLYDIKFPFDVYFIDELTTQRTKYFVPAGEWLSDALATENCPNREKILTTKDSTKYRIPGNSENGAYYSFIIPVWVKEESYTGTNGIQTRVIAENYPGVYNAKTADTYCENIANQTNTNYIATMYNAVDVVGKIYDLRVSSSDDPGWLNKIVNPGYITAKNFPFGQANQNTTKGYKYAPKLGYSFVFDFKTKGRKSNTVDIGVYPEFYFVGKDGKGLKKVDLYFRKSAALTDYVKIENSLPNTLNVRYSNTYMKVPQKEMVDSRRIYAIELFGKTYNYTSVVNIGSFAKMTLPHDLRLCFDTLIERYGDYDGVINIYGKDRTTIGKQAQADANSRFSGLQGEDHVIGSVGHWVVGYQLPSSTVAVLPGANIKTAVSQNQTLKNGYILVKMNIKTRDKNDPNTNNGYLQYTGPEALNEGDRKVWNDTTGSHLKPIILPNNTPTNVPIGTIAIYETDQRANNDYTVIGTH